MGLSPMRCDQPSAAQVLCLFQGVAPQRKCSITGSPTLPTMTDAQNEDGMSEAAVDQHILLLLDSVDHLLQLQHSLSHSLSQGWMEIASARYAMGHSRISQSLLSLRPCPASRIISVISAREASDNDGEMCDLKDKTDQQEVMSNRASALQFVLQNHVNGGTRYDIFNDSKHEHLSPQSSQKPKTEPISCFGKLISPHLRAAQTSFERALEIIVEIINKQNLIYSAKSKILTYVEECQSHDS